MSNPSPRAALRRATVPRPRRLRRPGTAPAARIVVVGDLMLDVVIAAARPLELGTDVPGRVSLRQGGSAATTARWLARLGARTTFVCSVGRDPEGRALTAAVSADGVRVRASRVAAKRTGRIGVVVAPGGERSFVADRAAADALTAGDLAASTFRADLLHLPAYSLLGEPLGTAGRRAIELARQNGALVSIDLASVGPLLARGRRAALRLVRDAAPDLLFATSAEAEAVAGRVAIDALADLSPLVVVKRGPSGATVLARDGDRRLAFDVATRPVTTADSTGAGDAFDAGFIVAWLHASSDSRNRPTNLRAAVLAAHRAAARQLAAPGKELSL
jgi:sugar/nucleoside kinase (ribokinase family)